MIYGLGGGELLVLLLLLFLPLIGLTENSHVIKQGHKKFQIKMIIVETQEFAKLPSRATAP